MGKEDSAFGFKDQAKALETLQLLQEHDMKYRKLTVRGLLGRAKRVLSITKAEDKKKNIKEAMEVFEKWLEDPEGYVCDEKNGTADRSGSDEKPTSEEDSPKTEGVPNLGFKDADAAEKSIQELQGRDPDYQRLAVKGLIGRAKRVLACTKDETKLNNINEAIKFFKKFLEDFEKNNLIEKNCPYLSLDIVQKYLKVAEERNLDVENQKSFIQAYAQVDGDYKRLRTVAEKEGGKTWDIVRNKSLEELREKNKSANLFNEEEVTDEHLQIILWAYSPKASDLKRKEGKRKSDAQDCDSKRKK